jgi:hypothetical protein
LVTTDPHSGLAPPSYIPCTAHIKKRVALYATLFIFLTSCILKDQFNI